MGEVRVECQIGILKNFSKKNFGGASTNLPLFCAFSLLLFSFIILSPATGRAATYGNGELITQLGIKFSSLSGYTRYHISYYEGPTGIESELEFPLRTYLLGPEGSIVYKDKRGREYIRLNFEALFNVDNGSGKLKDSDWLSNDIDIALYGIAHPGKDIYSESDIELRAFVFDTNLVYYAMRDKNFLIGPMVGYRHQSFRFIGSNVTQVGYGPYANDYSGFVPGEVIHYRVRYEFLYGGLRAQFLSGPLSLILSGGAGYVYAKDRDDHILRDKLAEAETDGYGLFFDLGVRYFIWKEVFLNGGGQYLKFHTTGTQHQYFYASTPDCPTGGCDAYVSDRIDFEQWTLSLGIGYRF